MKETFKLGMELHDAIGEIGSLETHLKDVSVKLSHLCDETVKYESEPTYFLWDNAREIRILNELMEYLVTKLNRVLTDAGSTSVLLLKQLRGKVVSEAKEQD